MISQQGNEESFGQNTPMSAHPTRNQNAVVRVLGRGNLGGGWLKSLIKRVQDLILCFFVTLTESVFSVRAL